MLLCVWFGLFFTSGTDITRIQVDASLAAVLASPVRDDRAVMTEIRTEQPAVWGMGAGVEDDCVFRVLDARPVIGD